MNISHFRCWRVQEFRLIEGLYVGREREEVEITHLQFADGTFCEG